MMLGTKKQLGPRAAVSIMVLGGAPSTKRIASEITLKRRAK